MQLFEVETCYCPPPVSLAFSQARRGYRGNLAQNAAFCKATATEAWAGQWAELWEESMAFYGWGIFLNAMTDAKSWSE